MTMTLSTTKNAFHLICRFCKIWQGKLHSISLWTFCQITKMILAYSQVKKRCQNCSTWHSFKIWLTCSLKNSEKKSSNQLIQRFQPRSLDTYNVIAICTVLFTWLKPLRKLWNLTCRVLASIWIRVSLRACTNHGQVRINSKDRGNSLTRIINKFSITVLSFRFGTINRLWLISFSRKKVQRETW